MSVLKKLDGATTRTHKVWLILDAALEAEWEDLNRQLDDAITQDAGDAPDVVKEGDSLAMPRTARIFAEMDERRDRVEASTVCFEFAPMDWPDRLALQAAHPPRKGDLNDQFRGYNVVTFLPALIRATCVKVTDAEGDEETDIPDATWDHLLGNPEADPPVKPTLVHGQVARLYNGAQATDQGVSRVPPSARSLHGIQDIGASLAQPSPGTSPRSDSEGGSPSGSPRSSTAKKAAPKKARSSGS